MEVSINLIVKNESKYIKNCINSLLNQSYQDFEIIIIDDNSSDNTLSIIKSFKDKRIKLINSKNNNYVGYGNLRNLTIDNSSGKYIFFTDGDCVAHYNWIKEALFIFNSKNCLGVEGKTFYESESAVSVSDYATYRMTPHGYMTCNVVYLKEALDKVKGFDSKFKFVYEDRDLAMKIKNLGEIYFEPNMLIFHQKKNLSIKMLFNRAKRAGDMVYFDYKHGRLNSEYIKNNILYPYHLLIILIPPLIFLGSRITSVSDFLFTVMKYFSFIYERFLIWKHSIKYKKLIF